MSISGIGGYQPFSTVKRNTKRSDKQLFNSMVCRQNSEVENRRDKTSEIWEKLSGEYSIRNATFDEFCEVSLKLYEAGEISLFEHAMITFNPSKSPQTPELDINITPVKGDGRRDWIAEFEARQKRDLDLNNIVGSTNNRKIIQILNMLDR